MKHAWISVLYCYFWSRPTSLHAYGQELFFVEAHYKSTIVVRFPKFSFGFQYHLSVMYSYQVAIRVTVWLSLSSDVSYSYSFTEFRNTVLTNLIVNLSAFLNVFSGCFMHTKFDARFGWLIPRTPYMTVICIIVDACILVHNKN